MSQRLRIPREQLPDAGGRRLFRFGEQGLLLFNVGGEYHAIDDGCPHGGASLFSGKLLGRLLQCPAHGLYFDLATGCASRVPGFGVRRHTLEWDADACIVVIADPAAEETTP